MRRKKREGGARENKHVAGGFEKVKSQARSEEDLYELVTQQTDPLLLNTFMKILADSLIVLPPQIDF